MNCAYKIIDKNSPWFGQVLEYASCSNLDNWTAVILFTEPKKKGLRNSCLFRRSQIEKV